LKRFTASFTLHHPFQIILLIGNMARLPRITPVDVPVHLIQRGNNRQVCFVSSDDHAAYAGWLKLYSEKYGVDVHAWVMMTNHVHILCTPRRTGAVSSMMQSLGRRYVRYFNYGYKRTGTLWEGRYKSCLIQAEQYLLEVYRYIELNPVRAEMVTDPGDYRWSSYRINAQGEKSDLCTPHPVYLALGKKNTARRNNYKELFRHHLDGELLKNIRTNLNSGMVVGNDLFKKEIKTLTGRRVQPKKRGRPLGWRKESV
jgi:putative transposase